MTEVTSSDLIRDGLTASGHGDLDAVEAVLDPEVIVQQMDGQGDLEQRKTAALRSPNRRPGTHKIAIVAIEGFHRSSTAPSE